MVNSTYNSVRTKRRYIACYGNRKLCTVQAAFFEDPSMFFYDYHTDISLSLA